MVVALVGWRLTRGPIDLAVLTPYVERALRPADGSLAVRVRTTHLVWDPGEHEVRLRLLDVQARGATDVLVAAVPVLTLRLSLRALLRGVIAPAEITFEGARLRVVVRPDGSLDLGLGTGVQTTAHSP